MRARRNNNGEAWLTRAAYMLRPWFRDRGYPIEADIRACLGTTQKGAVGLTHYPMFSDRTKTHHIFISPYCTDPVEVLGTLVHEMVHCQVGPKTKHGPAFKACALAVELRGKMTATTHTELAARHFEAMIRELGPFPDRGLTKQWG